MLTKRLPFFSLQLFPSRYCESLPPRHCEPFYTPVIASSSFPVIARSEATKQSPLLLHPVIANRRVGKCVGVKQSPRCSFLLVFRRSGEIASPDSYQACNDAPFRHCEECNNEAISSLHILVGVKCFEGIASLTTFARNDEREVFARNDERSCSLAMTSLPVIARAQPEAISSLPQFVIAMLPFLRREEAIAQKTLTLIRICNGEIIHRFNICKKDMK